MSTSKSLMQRERQISWVNFLSISEHFKSSVLWLQKILRFTHFNQDWYNYVCLTYHTEMILKSHFGDSIRPILLPILKLNITIFCTHGGVKDNNGVPPCISVQSQPADILCHARIFHLDLDSSPPRIAVGFPFSSCQTVPIALQYEDVWLEYVPT